MYITNPEVLDDDKLFYTNDERLVLDLIDKGFAYLSIKYIENKKYWMFSKTKELMAALKGVS